MKALVFNNFGGPEVLRITTVPDPVPGDSEVIIRVHAVSVNRTLDCVVRAGTYSHKPQLPHVLGVDPAGEIVAVGRRVTERRVGDRVVSSPIVARSANGAPQLLGVHCWGGNAEFVRLPAANTYLIPNDLNYAEACIVARHAPLAFAQLRDHGRLKPRDWVLVMGASGGLGAAAVQVAVLLGARVIAAAGTAERVASAIALGAEAGIDYRQQDLAAEVLRITGTGADIVLENIGDPALFPAALRSLACRGRLVTAGAHGGGIVSLDIRQLYQRQLTIVGAPEEFSADYAVSLDAAVQGHLRPAIHEVMALSAGPAAHRAVESRRINGKIVLNPALPLSGHIAQ